MDNVKDQDIEKVKDILRNLSEGGYDVYNDLTNYLMDRYDGRQNDVMEALIAATEILKIAVVSSYNGETQ